MVVAIMLPSFGTPIARLFPVEFLAQHAWQGLHLIELGCALLAGGVAGGDELPAVGTGNEDQFGALTGSQLNTGHRCRGRQAPAL